jgi:hypothetical protein
MLLPQQHVPPLKITIPVCLTNQPPPCLMLFHKFSPQHCLYHVYPLIRARRRGFNLYTIAIFWKTCPPDPLDRLRRGFVNYTFREADNAFCFFFWKKKITTNPMNTLT